MRYILLLFAFSITSTSCFCQKSYDNDDIWYTAEGMKLIFNDSIFNFIDFPRYNQRNENVFITDSAVYYTKTVVYEDKERRIDTTFFATYQRYSDSLKFNFKFIHPYGFYYLLPAHYRFLKEEVVFYNEKTFKSLPPIKNFKLYKTRELEIDSCGTITLKIKHDDKYGDRQLLGIYRGKFSDQNFKRFKNYMLNDSLFSMKPSKLKYLCNHPFKSNCLYCYETSNIKYCIERNFAAIPFDSLIYSDSAWKANQMRFYGYDENNFAPKKQIVYSSNVDINKVLLYAITGNCHFQRKVRSFKQEIFIYRCIVDSAYHRSYSAMEDHEYFIASPFRFPQENNIGVVLERKTVYWEKLDFFNMQEYPEYGKLSFFYVHDKFPTDEFVLFDFHTSCFYKTGYRGCYKRLPTNISEYISNTPNIEYKVSKAIQRIKRKNHR